MTSYWHEFAPAALPPGQPAGLTDTPGRGPDAARPAGRHRAVVQRRRRADPFVIAIPALAELVIGGYKLGALALSRDEADALTAARRPMTAIVSGLAHGGIGHGAYYLAMHVVIAGLGTSALVLRLPSLLAAVATAALTAALGRRLARQSGMPAPSAVGLLAGLSLAIVPLTTWCAQHAGPYTLAMLAAVGSTYCLDRAATGDSRGWWAGYSLCVLALGLAELFAVLLVAGHGLSLLLGRARSSRAARGVVARGRIGGRVMPAELTALASDAPTGLTASALRGWLASVACAGLGLAPLAWASSRQASALGLAPRPLPTEVAGLATQFAGRAAALPIVAAVAAVAVAAEVRWAGPGRTLGYLAVPWLVVPPVMLIAVSFDEPVLAGNVAAFCLPALSLLIGAGLVWTAWQIGLMAARRNVRRAGMIGTAAGVLIAAAIAALLVSPQLSVRRSGRAADMVPAWAVTFARADTGDAHDCWTISIPFPS